MKRVRAIRRSIFFVAATMLALSVPAAADEVSVVGTGDGIDVLRALAAAFMQENKSTRIDIPSSVGSAGGIQAVIAGKAVLGRVARVLTDAEAAAGINYEPFAILPSAFYVHRSAGVTSLTNGQVADVYSGRVTNWNQVGGADQRIRVVTREDGDSTLTVLRTTMPRWHDLVVTERAKTAITTQDAIETVRDTPGAIAFGPFTRTLERISVVLRIDGNYPTDTGYPSSVILALIYRTDTVTPPARQFLAFLGTAKARATIQGLGSVPIKKSSDGS